MRFYLSSFKLGEKAHLLAELYGHERPVAYISNALDHVTDEAWLDEWTSGDLHDLSAAGLRTERMDLRDFFGSGSEFKQVAASFSGVWFSGGNVFVLRQAMRLSGFDELVRNNETANDFTYGGYSAACCVLSRSLKPYAIVDDPDIHPYPEASETLWDGLGILDFAFMPHFQSNHSESALIEKEIDFCAANNIPYRTFRDGEVLLLGSIPRSFVDPALRAITSAGSCTLPARWVGGEARRWLVAIRG